LEAWTNNFGMRLDKVPLSQIPIITVS